MPTSLAGRLLAGTLLFTLVALVVTLAVMDHVFERFVTGQVDQRLDNKLVSLTSQIRVSPDGVIGLQGDADGPPFDDPRHMSFWQIQGPRNTLESRWLRPGVFKPPTQAEIDAAPTPPVPPHLGPQDGLHPRARTLHLPGPNDTPMHVRLVSRDIGGERVTILAAAPRRAIDDPMREALTTLASSLVVLSLVLAAAAFTLVRITLAPLGRLRREIADVRIGNRAAVPAAQPIEIKPLVDELNTLLSQNAANLTRARNHVANLVHGLKTPLATLSLGIGRLDRDARSTLEPLVEAIERRVRHHLGRARSAALGGPVRQQTALAPHIVDIIGALQKVYAEKHVEVTFDCPAELTVACEGQDVDEIIGNLLDNAFKYAERHVACRALVDGANIGVEIADDGPGLAPADLERVLRPGQRVDEQVPGFGFGLPIARELIELYGGHLALRPQARGIVAHFTLPNVPAEVDPRPPRRHRDAGPR